jgi:hypothetical protein
VLSTSPLPTARPMSSATQSTSYNPTPSTSSASSKRTLAPSSTALTRSSSNTTRPYRAVTPGTLIRFWPTRSSSTGAGIIPSCRGLRRSWTRAMYLRIRRALLGRLETQKSGEFLRVELMGLFCLWRVGDSKYIYIRDGWGRSSKSS